MKPETDLIRICAKCHRMIHHKKNAILTPDELRRIVSSIKRCPEMNLKHTTQRHTITSVKLQLINHGRFNKYDSKLTKYFNLFLQVIVIGFLEGALHNKFAFARKVQFRY